MLMTLGMLNLNKIYGSLNIDYSRHAICIAFVIRHSLTKPKGKYNGWEG